MDERKAVGPAVAYVTHCPECTQPAPPEAPSCPHCDHSFALYAKLPSLPPPAGDRTGEHRWWRRLFGRGGLAQRCYPFAICRLE